MKKNRLWDGESSVPSEALWFRDCGGTIEAAADVPGGFRMEAYTGAAMPHPWFGKVVISVAGVELGKTKRGGKKGILREHARDRIVGYGYPKKDGDRITVENGVFSQVTEDGRQVAGTLAEGYPWECSINIDRATVKELEPGQEMEVNGRLEKGPAVVFVRSRLREVSFCSLGMDAGTSASILASDGDMVEIEVERNPVMSEETRTEDVQTAAVEVDLEAEKEKAREEGRVEMSARFASFCEEFGREFGIKAFEAGWDEAKAKDEHYAELKAEVGGLRASVASAKIDDGRSEPVPVGAPAKEEEAPATFAAACELVQKKRNAAGENLTKGQAMQLALKLYPDLYRSDVLKK